MEKTHSISAYANALLVYDNSEYWSAASAEQSARLVRDVIKMFGPCSVEKPLFYRDSLCNWVAILIDRSGRFDGFLPLSLQPRNIQGRPLANFLLEQYNKALEAQGEVAHA